MNAWIAQQARALGRTCRKLGRTPFATLFNVMVLGVALALPAGLYLGLVNLQNAAGALSPEPELTVFVALEASPSEVQALGARLAGHAGVRRARHVPRDAALEALQRSSGMPSLAEGLGGNPLPDAYVVESRDAGAAALERLRAELAGWPNVAHVQLDALWAQRLDAALELGRFAVLLLAGVLAFALVAVTFNTIRLQILTQREEIEVSTLIGATAGFIRRPFLYYGTFLGLAGGLAACVLVWAAMTVLNAALLDLAHLYGARWQLHFLTPADVGSLLAFAGALGWFGAWMSVSRHLAEARPL